MAIDGANQTKQRLVNTAESALHSIQDSWALSCNMFWSKHPCTLVFLHAVARYVGSIELMLSGVVLRHNVRPSVPKHHHTICENQSCAATCQKSEKVRVLGQGEVVGHGGAPGEVACLNQASRELCVALKRHAGPQIKFQTCCDCNALSKCIRRLHQSLHCSSPDTNPKCSALLPSEASGLLRSAAGFSQVGADTLKSLQPRGREAAVGQQDSSLVPYTALSTSGHLACSAAAPCWGCPGLALGCRLRL